MVPMVFLLAVVPVLWTDPGAMETIDFKLPARGSAPPQAPFYFLNEDFKGNSPKVMVRDANGVEWQVKGGPEARAEAFLSRLVAAIGYYTDAVTFLAHGRIEGLKQPLKRASGFVGPDGSFTYAGFERREAGARFLPRPDWTWLKNPFAGTPELKGLKILIMLVSNWDNKDGRDLSQGSNTGVLEIRSKGDWKHIYFVTDWGQSLGGWGRFTGRSNWNCADYRRQTPELTLRSSGGRVQFGFGGQHTSDFAHDISPGDVAWLMQRLGAVTDKQLRSGLETSGAAPAEAECFTKELRARIEALRAVAKGPQVTIGKHVHVDLP